MLWTKLVHLGDLPFTLSAAAALSAWLLAARAWRMAFWWSLLFALGIGVVGATKVAFLGWGTALPALEFKALSGHAAGVTAVYTTLFYLLLWHRGRHARVAGIAAGLLLGALMGVLLVAEEEHSPAEAAAGWAIGALVSLGGIWKAGELPAHSPAFGLVGSGLVFVAAIYILRSVPFGWLMVRTAVFLSGNTRPFPWGAGS
ncbi:MAG: hypothetical protein ABWY27_16895 [Telluria sp.]